MLKTYLSVATVVLSLVNACLSFTEKQAWFCPWYGTETISCEGTSQTGTIFVISATYGKSCSCPPCDMDCQNINCCRTWNATQYVKDFCNQKSVCTGSFPRMTTSSLSSCATTTTQFLRVSYICQSDTTPVSKVTSTALPRANTSTSQPATSSATATSVPGQTFEPSVSDAMDGVQQSGTVIVAPGTGGITTLSTSRPFQSNTKTVKSTSSAAAVTKSIQTMTTEPRVSMGRTNGVRLAKAQRGGRTLPVTIGVAVGVSVLVLTAVIVTVVIVMKRRRMPTPSTSSPKAITDVTTDVTTDPEPTYDTIREEEEGGVQLALSGATCSYSAIGQPNVTSGPDRQVPVYSKPDKNKAKTPRNVEDLYAKPNKKESGQVENVLYESSGGLGASSSQDGADNVLYASADEI